MKQAIAIIIAGILVGCASTTPAPQPMVHIKTSIDPHIGNLKGKTVFILYEGNIDTRKILSKIENILRDNGVSIVDATDTENGSSADLMCGVILETKSCSVPYYTTKSMPSNVQGYFGDQPFYASANESKIIEQVERVTFKKVSILILNNSLLQEALRNAPQTVDEKAKIMNRAIVWDGTAYCYQSDFVIYQNGILNKLLEFYGTDTDGDYPLNPTAP